MQNITLTKGKTAIVDDDFFAYCQTEGLKFYFQDQGAKCKHRGYAVHDGRLGRTRMHYLVLRFHGVDVPSGMEVDHINSNPLDNRFENLQIITRRENLLKKKRDYVNETGYKGVIVRRDGRSSGTRFRAYVNHEGKTHYNGMHATAEEAARAHDELAKRLQGKFANLNFPD